MGAHKKTPFGLSLSKCCTFLRRRRTAPSTSSGRTVFGAGQVCPADPRPRSPPRRPPRPVTTAPGVTLAQQRAALVRATAQASDARKRSEQLESRATLAAAAADRTRDQAAALAARIQQSEADPARRRGPHRHHRHPAACPGAPHRAAPATIARLTAALQQLARRSPILALVEPGPVGDAVHRRIVLSQMLPVVLARTRDLRAELARSAQLRRE